MTLPSLAPHPFVIGLLLECVWSLETEKQASEAYGAKAKVLKDLVEHHAAEEEKEMFSKARTALDIQALQQLGSRMLVRRDEILRLEAWAQRA